MSKSKKKNNKLKGDCLDQLYEVIVSRVEADPESSYTAKLIKKGVQGISKKVGEEAVEAVIEGVAGSKERLAEESGDLLYHLMVLWAARGLQPSEVWQVMAARRGISGLVEKASR
ncbi:MAG: phosphoribosyl-ATP diphosphatase [Kiloniellales bacterium]|nr:phosphoribosyl-ATP diphosphatase [Kiloniellales bacterium]